MRAVGLALLALLITPAGLASAPASIDAGTSCAPFAPGAECSFTQTGTISIVCPTSCEIIVQGELRATDAAPLKRVELRLQVGGIGSSTQGCTAAGTGTTTCPVAPRFPLFLAEGSCVPVTLTARYMPLTLTTGATLTRGYEVCRGSEGYAIGGK